MVTTLVLPTVSCGIRSLATTKIDTNLREAAGAGVFRLVLSEFGLTCVLPPSSLLLSRLRLSALLCSCRLGSDRGCVSVRRVVCCLVRTALSWSSPVDLASLAWLLRDEQSSYDEVARLALVAIVLINHSLYQGYTLVLVLGRWTRKCR